MAEAEAELCAALHKRQADLYLPDSDVAAVVNAVFRAPALFLSALQNYETALKTKPE